MRKHRSSQGSMLLVALEVLALLAILAVSFFSIMNLELKIGRSTLELGKAKALALAGVETAIAELREKHLQKGYDWLYENWTFEPDVDHGVGALTPLEEAQNPSFVLNQTVNNKAVSGILSQSATEVHFYKLKVWDHTSRININDPQPALASMLNHLGEAIALYTSLPDPVQGEGDRILEFRNALPEKRFQSLEDLKVILGEERANTLGAFITFYGPRDPRALRPHPRTNHVDTEPDTGVGDHASTDSHQNGAPTGTFFEPRQPINLNTASKPVLYALFRGLRGYRTAIRVLPSQIYAGRKFRWEKTEVTFDDAAKVQALVDKIADYRKNTPFVSWQQWEEFLQNLVSNGTLQPEEAELIQTNSNPTFRPIKFAPPAAFLQIRQEGNLYSYGVDKLDLIYYTTEVCFSALGSFHIESRGYIETTDGRLLATAKVNTDVQVYAFQRLTTQADFLQHRSDSDGILAYPDPRVHTSPAQSDVYLGWLQLEPFPSSPFLPTGQIQMECLFSNSLTPNQPVDFQSFLSRADLQRVYRLSPQPGLSVNTDKKDDTSLLRGGDLSMDGMLSWNERERIFEVNGSSAAPRVRGALEFWIQLLTPPELGTNEVLFYGNRKLSIPGLQGRAIHLTLRVERYGTQLSATLFVWGDRVPFRFVWASVEKDISDWRPGEWHHVVLTWDKDNPGTDKDLWMYVDGELHTSEDGLEGYQEEPPVTVTIGGTTITLVPKQTQWRVFSLVSYRPNFEGAVLGGYRYEPTAPTNLYGLYFSPKDHPNRFATAVLDDIRLYRSPLSSPPSTVSRFEANNTSPPYFDLAFSFPEPVTISHLRASIRYPSHYGQQVVYQRGATQLLAVDLLHSLSPSGPWTSTTVNQFPDEGRAISTSAPVKAEQNFYLRLRMRNPGGIDPLNVTPVVEDVWIFYLPDKVRYLQQKWTVD